MRDPNTIMAEPRSHKLVRNASFLLAGQIAASVLSVALTAVLGRWLGVAEFGMYYFLIAVSTFAYVLVDWGQSMYLVRESARRPADGGRLLGGALAFRAGAALVALPVTAALVKVIGYDNRTAFLALLAVLCGLPLALSQTYGYIFRGRDRMDLDATVTVT